MASKHANVFVFRRDLRTVDNLALELLQQAHPDTPTILVFIFNPQQIHPEKNPYYSAAAVEFMIECLGDIPGLQCFYGEDIDVMNRILKQVPINAIGFNTDYTPFARARDDQLSSWAASHGIQVVTANDYVLFDFKIKTEGGKDYSVYTPFYRKCMANSSLVPRPETVPFEKNTGSKIYNKPLQGAVKASRFLPPTSMAPPERTIRGGRKNALAILEKIRKKHFAGYEKERDYPALDKTTKLSAYMKFGCVSVRETFYESLKAYGPSHGLVRELIWREFYANVLNHIPHVLEGQVKKHPNRPMYLKYDGLKWPQDTATFRRWCEGRTGFPFVDAAMICMNRTGYMHNRLRMIVAMFLTKDMHQDWRLGERYFATRLVDYDPASNSGGWQWAGSIGADAQPYFRIFNPWSQSERFDKDAAFIKRWIPALKDVPARSIHRWYDDHGAYKHTGYPAPMLDHATESRKAISYFSK